eukprot:1119100-Pyramimonas_sp.AAC.3
MLFFLSGVPAGAAAPATVASTLTEVLEARRTAFCTGERFMNTLASPRKAFTPCRSQDNHSAPATCDVYTKWGCPVNQYEIASTAGS